ncbi:rRNA biogenesis protein rrp36-like [Papaver somniferum]|uniref:rRNA biogenesis protein rrp36-like n=1 Tax=Papaver somniferum TaxID=3469 RepID=UPI000E6F7A6C|nr:rRNA biogenesis protein rrp36-like [Papaver somniferum]
MVTSSSSDYDYSYSSSSSEEDSKAPAAKSRAKMNRTEGAKPKNDEPVWVPRDLKIKPDRRTREIEKLVKADLEAEREKEEYWDSLYNDPEIHPDFVNGPDSDSDEEFEEDSASDDDDESDNSDKSDNSDESDE